MNKLARSAKVTFTILEGDTILQEGQEVARHLWNFTRYCALSYNRKVQRWREGRIYEQDKDTGKWYPRRQSLAGKLPKYPGFIGMDKALRDHWAAHKLSDHCFTYTLKEFDIAMRSWFSNLKSNSRARPPRYAEDPRQLTFEVGRNAKHLGDWRFRLTVLGGHIPERHAIVKVHVRPGVKVRDTKLIRVQPDGTGTIVYYTHQEQRQGDGVAGIDLGIINIACAAFQTGESILYSGKGILTSDQWYQKRAAKCKPSGWSKGKAQEQQSKRNSSYRRKAGNTRQLAVHNVTRSIVDECVKRGVGTIVLGDLKHIRDDKDFGKRGNQKLHAWPFAEVLRQITYKAEEVGIQVITVSEAYTSKTCHACGVIGRRVERGLFKCPDCGLVINADVNGAFNILNKVSPVPVRAGVGVEADLPGLPSPPARAARIGKAGLPASQIEPTFVAKFDLRNWSIKQARCTASPTGLAHGQSSHMGIVSAPGPATATGSPHTWGL